MPIEKKPFESYQLDEEKDSKREILTISINKEERERLNGNKKLLEQPKDGTAIKQMMEIADFVIHDNFFGKMLKLVLDNKRRNKRLGIIDFD